MPRYELEPFLCHPDITSKQGKPIRGMMTPRSGMSYSI
jgi:hypothetical protein